MIVALFVPRRARIVLTVLTVFLATFLTVFLGPFLAAFLAAVGPAFDVPAFAARAGFPMFWITIAVTVASPAMATLAFAAITIALGMTSVARLAGSRRFSRSAVQALRLCIGAETDVWLRLEAWRGGR